MEEARKTLAKLILGVWIMMALITLAAVVIQLVMDRSPLSFFLGELLGSITTTGLFIHMYNSIDIALDAGERAKSYTKRSAFIRSFIAVAVLAFSCYFSATFNPFGTLLGLLGMKLSVYIQPLLDKIEQKKWHKRKEI